MSSATFLEKADRWLARRLMQKTLPLRRSAGVVSFTFDDAPASACHEGSALLEKAGCLGTWYIAGGLTGKPEQGIPCHSIDDLQQLAAAGHEIGCHTFSHRPCQGLSRSGLRDEFQRNGDFLAQVTGSRPAHFSFPLGIYGMQAKACAGETFMSSRLTRAGIHFGEADLNGLLAQRLYAHEMSVERLAELVKATAEGGGWLIFYTHDVSQQPGQWGCTPALLEAAIRLAIDNGCRVLPVGQAIEYWRGND
jgi:peptidoglycan/xylan/chitin deacetylase (PgdA/CDA1 family)